MKLYIALHVAALVVFIVALYGLPRLPQRWLADRRRSRERGGWLL